MPHYVVSDLGLHCLPMTLLWVSRLKWVICVLMIHVVQSIISLTKILLKDLSFLVHMNSKVLTFFFKKSFGKAPNIFFSKQIQDFYPVV